MSLSIRQWLAEHNIEITQLQTPGAQTAGVAFRIFQDMEVKSLTPFDISPFAELLELPLGILWENIDCVCQLSVELLRVWSRKKPLKRNEGTWLAFQIAYVRALQKVLGQEFILKRPWLARASVPIVAATEENKSATLVDPMLQALLKTLRPGRLSDTQAEQALSTIGDSFLVGQMNSLAIAWFVTNGLEEIAAKLIVGRLLNSLPGYLLGTIAENALPLAQLQRFVRLGNVANNNSLSQILTDDETISLEAENEFAALSANTATPNLIDEDRENYRATLLQSLSEPVLGELFALKDIYVPLKAVLVEQEKTKMLGWEKNSSVPPSPSSPPVDLMEWAIAQVSDLETVAIVQGEPGSGKTSFCQMLATKVAQEMYPSWMPVLVPLRDSIALGSNLNEMLDSALKAGKFTSNDGWLSPLQPPCVLIFDGLEELPRSPSVERQFAAFLDRVRRFQMQYATASGRPRHKIFITCRSNAIESIAGSLPFSFRRIAIQPFEQDELKQWFKLWSKLQPKNTAQSFFNFLKQAGVFRQLPEVKDFAVLVHQPLTLMLLAILYRGGRLDERMFVMRGWQVKFEMYDRFCRWLLGEAPDGMFSGNSVSMMVREGLTNVYRTPEAIANLLQGRTPTQLRRQMETVAIALLQTGRYRCVLPLTEETELGEDSFSSFLPAYYFRDLNSPSKSERRMEFSHPSLGDYLCAQGLARELKSLTRRVADAYGESIFAIDSPTRVAQHIYNLLGYGILSSEVEEMTIEQLRREEARDRSSFSFRVLAERLYNLYRAYSCGRWLDEGLAHTTRSYLQSMGNSTNVLQIDAAVGLNVFLLLCACHREISVAFSPCGNVDIPEDFNADRLLGLIGRTAVLSPNAFFERSRNSLMLLNLAKACLHRVMLAGVNFWKANLFGAELVGANLAGANLQEVNLSWANLTNADLSDTNLSAAKLDGANLTGANLWGANLQLASFTNACLFDAKMDEVTRDLAAKSGALFSLQQYRACQQALASLETGRNAVPLISTSRVNQNLEPDSTLLLIERSEGAINSLETRTIDSNNDETMFL